MVFLYLESKLKNMKRLSLFILFCFGLTISTFAQNMMTPELLWKLKRLSPIGISDDGKNIVYTVTEYEVEKGERTTKKYTIPVKGGTPAEIENFSNLIKDKSVSPDKSRKIEIEKVKIEKILGKDLYPNLQESNVYVYNDLYYRHWDTWNDGTFNHLILKMNGD